LVAVGAAGDDGEIIHSATRIRKNKSGGLRRLFSHKFLGRLHSAMAEDFLFVENFVAF
jgi:hypothetical protein